MTTLALYLDESLNSNSALDLVIAGYVAPIDAWAEFGEQWSQLLANYGLRHFRMKDFKNANSRLFRHLTKYQRKDLLDSALSVITQNVHMGVSCRIWPRRYESLTTPAFRSKYGSAYGLTATCAVALVTDQVEQYLGPDCTVDVFLEDGHPNAAEVVRLITEERNANGDIKEALPEGTIIVDAGAQQDRLKIGSVGLGTKATMMPLHAADTLAYTTFTSSDWFSQTVLDRLRSSVPHLEVELTADSIQRVVRWIAEDEARRLQTRQELHEVSRFIGNLGGSVRPVPGGVAVDLRNLTENVTEEDIARLIRNDPTITVHWHKRPS